MRRFPPSSWEVRSGYVAPSFPQLKPERPLLKLNAHPKRRSVGELKTFALVVKLKPIFGRPPIFVQMRYEGKDRGTCSLWDKIAQQTQGPFMGCIRMELVYEGHGACLNDSTWTPFTGTSLGDFELLLGEGNVLSVHDFEMIPPGTIDINLTSDLVESDALQTGEGLNTFRLHPMGALAPDGAGPDEVIPFFFYGGLSRGRAAIFLKNGLMARQKKGEPNDIPLRPGPFFIGAEGACSLGEIIRAGSVSCALRKGDQILNVQTVSFEAPSSSHVRLVFSLDPQMEMMRRV